MARQSRVTQSPVDDRSAPPSVRAQQRLAERLRHDVADTRVRLDETALRAEALRDAGFPAAAGRVVDEQRELVRGLQSRVEAAVADGCVEREAERVLEALPAADLTPDRVPDLPPARLPGHAAAAAPVTETTPTRSRLGPVAGVAAAVALLLAGMLIGLEDRDRTQLAGDGTNPSAPTDGAAAPGAGAVDGAAPSGSGHAEPAGGAAGASDRRLPDDAAGHHGGLATWFGDDAEGATDGAGALTPLPDIDAVIARLLASVELLDETVETARETAEDETADLLRRPTQERERTSQRAPDRDRDDDAPEQHDEDGIDGPPAPDAPQEEPDDAPSDDEEPDTGDDEGDDGDDEGGDDTPVVDDEDISEDVEQDIQQLGS